MTRPTQPRSALSLILAALYIAAGLGLTILGLPLAFLPFHWEGLARWVPWALMAAPVWLGIASGPGCLASLTLVLSQKRVSPRWCAVSLWGGLIASTVAVAGASWMPLFAPFGFLLLIGNVVMLHAFSGTCRERGRSVLSWWTQVLATVVVVFVVSLWALRA